MARVVVVTSWLVLLSLGFGVFHQLLFQQELESGLMTDADSTDIPDSADASLSLQALHNNLALKSAFAKAPLSAQPFVVRLVSISKDEPDSFELQRRLAEHVLRIAPRQVAARLKLAELNYLDGEYGDAAAGIARLIVLNRENAMVYSDMLSAMALQKTSRPIIEELLSEKPVWGAQIVNKLAGKLSDTDFLISLARDYPASQDAVVRSLISKGDLENANSAFLQFLSTEARETRTIPFDNRFEQKAGAQPFNWRINQSFASFDQGGGLAVSFFGRGKPWIAEQIIELSSGIYEANFVMDGNLYDNGGSFEWSLECLDARKPLLTLSIDTLTSLPEAKVVTFTVPDQSCPYLRLRLSGVAGEFPRTARAFVREVRLTPASEVATP
ncbi:hypothetical protein KUV46_11955 [Thalassovita mediterranea]|nr:hypothetical protein KUV46_11955 [Thalassovita mediterranea]